MGQTEAGRHANRAFSVCQHNLQRALWQRAYYVTVELSGAADMDSTDWCHSSRVKKTVISKVSFGGGCINDTIIHLSNEKLPFGGVGNSGMGAYHGKHSYETFSREKSIMEKGNWLDIPFRYPPYGKCLPLLKKLLK